MMFIPVLDIFSKLLFFFFAAWANITDLIMNNNTILVLYRYRVDWIRNCVDRQELVCKTEHYYAPHLVCKTEHYYAPHLVDNFSVFAFDFVEYACSLGVNMVLYYTSTGNINKTQQAN